MILLKSIFQIWWFLSELQNLWNCTTISRKLLSFIVKQKHGWVELAEAQQSRGGWFTEELTSDILLRQCSHIVTLLTQDVTTLRLYFSQKYRYFLFVFVRHELIVFSPSVADGKHFISILTRLNCFDKLVFLIPLQSSPSKKEHNTNFILYYR